MSVSVHPIARYGVDARATGRHVRRSAIATGLRQVWSRLTFPNVCYIVLRLVGWLATTLLVTFGLFVLLFLLVGNGTLAGMLEQVEQFARHYGEAPPALRAPFDDKLRMIVTVVFFVTAFFRVGSLISLFLEGLDGPFDADRA